MCCPGLAVRNSMGWLIRCGLLEGVCLLGFPGSGLLGWVFWVRFSGSGLLGQVSWVGFAG